jgi:hypothetical protein
VSLARRSKVKTAEASSFFLNQEASAIDGPAAHKFFSFLVLIANRAICVPCRALAETVPGRSLGRIIRDTMNSFALCGSFSRPMIL